MRFSGLLSEVWRLYRARFWQLTAAALLIFIPVALLEALAGEIPSPGDNTSALEGIAEVTAGMGSVAVSTIAEAFFAGLVSAMVIGSREGRSDPLRSAVRSLPIVRLVAANVLYGVAVLVGLLLLVVPGVVFLAWFALVAPIIEVEGRGIIDAFRRSRLLVRPHFWRVLLVIVPLSLASDLISNFVFSGAISAFGESLGGEWAGSVVAEILTAPFLALFVVVLFLELRQDPASTRPRGTSS